MVVQKNFNVGLIYKAESVYGTGVAPDTAVGRVNSANFKIDNNPIKVRNLGAGRNVVSSLYGPLDAAWNWEQEFHDPEVFKLAIGPKTGFGSSGTPYLVTESSAVATTGIPFFTLEKSVNDSTDEDSTMTGCVVEGFTLSFALNTTAKLSMNGVGRTTTNDTSATAYTEVSTLPWVFHQITCAWGSSPTTIGRVQSGSITYKNNLQTYRELGSRFISQPEPGVRDYTFTLTVLMSETSYQTLRTSFNGAAGGLVDGVSSAAFVTTDELKLTFSEGASTGNRNVTVWLDECVIDTLSEPAQQGSGLVQVTFNGHAHKGKDATPIKWWTA